MIATVYLSFMEKLKKRKQTQPSIKVMTVDEVYLLNQKAISKEEEKKKEDDDLRKQMFPIREVQPEKPIETAHEFLQKEGPSRLFTVPKLTKTSELSSDDVCTNSGFSSVGSADCR